MRLAWLLVLAACASRPSMEVRRIDHGPPARPIPWQLGVRLQGGARDTGRVVGRIVDATTRTPLELATVVASSPGLPTVSEFTDDEGEFLLDGLRPGRYSLLAIYGESRVAVDDVTVVAGTALHARAGLDTSGSYVIIFRHYCGGPDISHTKQGRRLLADELRNVPWAD